MRIHEHHQYVDEPGHAEFFATIEGGVSGSIQEVGIGAALGAHVIVKPLPGNHYRVARRLTPAGTTLAGKLFTFRNPTASGFLAVIKRVKLVVIQVAAPTAAIQDDFTLKVARGYTIADTTNGTDIAAAANMQEMRSSMGTSICQIREASAAAGISGGTSTLDTNSISTGGVWVAAALGSYLAAPQTIFDYYPNVADGEHPLVLAEQEGFQIANSNNFGAVSGIVLHVEFYWGEVTLY